MPTVPIRDRSWRTMHIGNFSGGFATTPQNDGEAERFINFDMQRDGFPVSRLGATKVNDASIGTTLPVGGGIGDAGGLKIVVAKKGTTWHYATYTSPPTLGTPTYTFTSFTVPNTPGDDPVKMDSVLDTTGASFMVFANKNFTNLVKWSGTGAAANIATSPAAKYVRWYQGHLYAAGLTNAYSVQFSDSSDPFTWPTTNEFKVPSRTGAITGLEVQPGFLAIFTERAIYALQGDPPLNSRLIPIHERIGCVHPNTISTFGTTTAFVYQDAVMALSGGIKVLSDNIRGRSIAVVGAESTTAWAVLTPFYYVLNQAQNTSSPPAAQTAGTPNGTVNLFLLDRVRFQHWSNWSYGTTSQPGTTLPYQAVVFAGHQYGYFMPSGDGSLYYQPFRENRSIDDTTGLPSFTQDAGSVWPNSNYRCRRFYFGDSCMQKRVGQVTVGGYGTGCVLNAITYAIDNTRASTQVATGNLPITSNLTATDASTVGVPVCSGFQVDITGTQMLITSADISYRPERMTMASAI